MSAGAEGRGSVELPPQWTRLERRVEASAVALATWRRRALEAEEEVARLQQALDELAMEREQPSDLRDAAKRLRAENAALQSRMLQARKRVNALLRRLATLEVEP